MKIIKPLIILNIISRLLLLESAALLICLVVALIYGEEIGPYLYSFGLTALPAFLIWAGAGRQTIREIGIRDGYLAVTLSWVTVSLWGIFPYLFDGSITNFTDALFESASGFTTTGSSILTDIEALPKSLLFWRSLTHWIGGIGIVLLVIIILPRLNLGGYRFFTMESSIQEKTHPRIKEMGKRLLLIYIALTFIEVLFLMAGHMNLFEGLCHSFGTIATGGFSPKNNSIESYSPYIQYVIILFMLLSGANFVLHYYALKGDFRKLAQNEEIKFYLGVIIISGLIIAGILHFTRGMQVEQSLRESYFQVISVLTSTGFATTDYLKWPTFAWILLFLLMFIGGSTGSTSGGIKMARHLLVLKNLKLVFNKMMNPSSVQLVKLNGKEIPQERNILIINFVVLYLAVFIISTMILAGMGLDAESSAGSVITVMGNIGPGLGITGPASNFFMLPVAAKLLLTILMFVGRLEIFTIVILFIPSFWRS